MKEKFRPRVVTYSGNAQRRPDMLGRLAVQWLGAALLFEVASLAADGVVEGSVHDADSTPSPKLIFLHIQKAGGHSVDAFFASPLSPLKNQIDSVCTFGWKSQAIFEKRVYAERGVEEAGLPAWLTKDAFSSFPKEDAFAAMKPCRCRIISAEIDGELVATLKKRWVQLCGGPTPLTATILREPAARAVSAVNHQFTQSKKLSQKPNRIGPALLFPISQGGVLSHDCVHNSSFCAGLSDQRRCRFQGSCGYFQDFQAATLAGFFASPMNRLIELDTDSDALLSVATHHLDAMDVVGITDAMGPSLCLLAHKLHWSTFFDTCCRSSTGQPQQAGCQTIFETKENAREQAHIADRTLLRAAAKVNRVDQALYSRAIIRFAAGLKSLETLTSSSFELNEAVRAAIRTAAQKRPSLPLPLRPLPHWLSPHERRRLGPDATNDDGNGGLKRYTKGLAIIAMGTNVSFREAYRASSSARQLYGSKLHITMLTDASGLLATKPFSEGNDFDRVVSVSGNLQWWAEHTKNQLKPSGRVYQAGHLMFAMRQLKQHAFITAATLYDFVVVTDADTFHCDGRALTAMFGLLESGSDLVAVSPARNFERQKGADAQNDPCEPVMNELSPKQPPDNLREVEINTGVVGLRGKSQGLRRMLQRWAALYSTLSLLPCGQSKQDQKAFRVAMEEAETTGGLQVKRLFRDAANKDSTVSMQPFNCRARPRDDNDARQPEEAHCADPRFATCSILHGHRLAARNTRLGTAADNVGSAAVGIPADAVGVHVFLHIPKTAGNSFKQTLLTWLLPKKKTRTMHITTAHAALNQGTRWSPSELIVGSFASSTCDWIVGGAGTARAVLGDGSSKGCGLFTVFRDPVDRMISELNYCEEIGWYKDQTCSGAAGADDLRALVRSARGRAGTKDAPGAALLAFAKVRGNVQLEHIAGPLSKADFAVEPGTPADWHDRPVGNRTTPIERRRRRLGPANTADLAAAEYMLKHRYLAVGLTERFNESMIQMAAILAPDRRFTLDAVLSAHSSRGHTHDHRSYGAETQRVERSALTSSQLDELNRMLQLDNTLYAAAVKAFEDQTARLKLKMGSH